MARTAGATEALPLFPIIFISRGTAPASVIWFRAARISAGLPIASAAYCLHSALPSTSKLTSVRTAPAPTISSAAQDGPVKWTSILQAYACAFGSLPLAMLRREGKILPARWALASTAPSSARQLSAHAAWLATRSAASSPPCDAHRIIPTSLSPSPSSTIFDAYSSRASSSHSDVSESRRVRTRLVMHCAATCTALSCTSSSATSAATTPAFTSFTTRSMATLLWESSSRRSSVMLHTAFAIETRSSSKRAELWMARTVLPAKATHVEWGTKRVSSLFW